MHQAACNRLLVSHSQHPVAPEPGEHCTTQSIATAPPQFTCLTADDLSHISSPASQGTETTEPVLTPSSDQPPCAPSADIQYYSQFQPQVSYPSTPTLKAIYSAAPFPSSDKSRLPFEIEDLSHLNSPIHNTPGLSSGISCRNISALASPTSWPVSESFYPQFTWDQEDGLQDQQMSTLASSFDDHFPRQMARSSSTSHNTLPANPSTTESEFPGHLDESTLERGLAARSPGLSVQEGSPQLKEGVVEVFPLDEDAEMQGTMPSHQAQPNEQLLEADDTAKTGEPYARLIYRAFMSRETHSMTLQEIYQWFRENTDKAKSESKGWQNSIRHNLSMNGAFVKRDRKTSADDPAPTHPQETKKSTEWVLQDWAVRDGVQSTTRYRKGNPGRRAAPSMYQRAQSNIASRTSSGRKGAPSASKPKTAGARRSALNRTATHHHQNVFHGHGGSFQAYHHYPPTHHRPLEYNYHTQDPADLGTRGQTLQVYQGNWQAYVSSPNTGVGPVVTSNMAGFMHHNHQHPALSPSHSQTVTSQPQYSLANLETGYRDPRQGSAAQHPPRSKGMIPVETAYGPLFAGTDEIDQRGFVWDGNPTLGDREYH
ncbi:hypothetical protein GGR50DRAFT_704954 [Xylaria sp. CBS 124048]|nr:hypothetical protein GGR50DRAFT_704954 [Xylaria sp. CBS 124048]